MLPPHKFSTMLKIREYPKEKFSATYKGIKMLNGRFEQYLKSGVGRGKVVGITDMCGPGNMIESF